MNGRDPENLIRIIGNAASGYYLKLNNRLLLDDLINNVPSVFYVDMYDEMPNRCTFEAARIEGWIISEDTTMEQIQREIIQPYGLQGYEVFSGSGEEYDVIK